MQRAKFWRKAYYTIGIVALVAAFFWAPQTTHAAAGQDFHVQVSPSPLVVSLTPGQKQTASITVRNFSNHSETLYPSLTSFAIDNASKKIELSKGTPSDVASWVRFSQTSITLAAGQSRPLEINYDTPKDVGFSYAFAVTLSRAGTTRTPGTAQLEGAIAVFNLVTINRADATRELTVQAFDSSSSRYEFLPANFSLSIHNNGNVIAQPTGNIFIQRTADATEPIAVLPFNGERGYILPGKSRTFESNWQEGFPKYITTRQADNGSLARQLSWNWKDLNQIRIGRYVAKAVVVYNDGHGSAAVTTTHSFWVIPWRLLAGLLGVALLLVAGMIAIGVVLFRMTRRFKRAP